MGREVREEGFMGKLFSAFLVCIALIAFWKLLSILKKRSSCSERYRRVCLLDLFLSAFFVLCGIRIAVIVFPWPSKEQTYTLHPPTVGAYVGEPLEFTMYPHPLMELEVTLSPLVGHPLSFSRREETVDVWTSVTRPEKSLSGSQQDLTFCLRWPGRTEVPPNPGQFAERVPGGPLCFRATPWFPRQPSVKGPQYGPINFRWYEGVERISFTMRRIYFDVSGRHRWRFRLALPAGYQVLRESPTRSAVEYEARTDKHIYTYYTESPFRSQATGFSVVFADSEAQKIEQYLLIFSGLFVGLSCEFLADFIRRLL